MIKNRSKNNQKKIEKYFVSKKICLPLHPLRSSISVICSVNKYGQIPEWPNGADCKSAGLRLRWFESIFAHAHCGSSSVDRALAFQAEGRGFEPRLPLNRKAKLLL